MDDQNQGVKNKTNHCKIQIVETYDSEAKLSVGTVWRINKDAIRNLINHKNWGSFIFFNY